MQRIPEPELMTTKEQVDAYAEADFSSGDSRTLALVVFHSGARWCAPFGSPQLRANIAPRGLAQITFPSLELYLF